jgi:hypothetical protein
MNAARRGAAFVALVVVMFGLAFGLGKLIDVDDPAPAPHHGAEPTPDPADASYSLAILGGERQPGESPLRFRIVDRGGEPITDFALRHEKLLHLIVVEQHDPRIYQHVHPVMASNGTWSVPLDLAPGTYAAYADGQIKGGEPQVMMAELVVAGDPPSSQLPAASTVAEVDGYTVKLVEQGGIFTFDVRRDGKAVALQPYLGAGGHLVVIGVKDLSYLHAHAMEAAGSSVGFHVAGLKAGRYALHFDFQVDGVVHSAPFLYDAKTSASSDGTDMDMDDMDMDDMEMGEMSGHDH